MIFLAFAIQLGPIGERLAVAPMRPSDCLTLCDGGLLAIWYDTADAAQAASVEAAAAMVRAAGDELAGASTGDSTPLRPGLGWWSPAMLPIPPPARC